jgi:uncharacterized protein YdhG (YjbR/CyaY superfamily)
MMGAMNPRNPEVDTYIEQLEPKRREALSQLRTMILDTVPGAVETMRYRMPTYEYGKGVLCAMASQKRYMSLYMEVDVVEEHKESLKSLSIGKSCIRFTSLEKLPLEEIRAMLNETVENLEGS